MSEQTPATEPLPISVAIAADVLRCDPISHHARVDYEKAIDAHVRPLVEALQEAEGEMRRLLGSDPAVKAQIDAALKAAGAE